MLSSIIWTTLFFFGKGNGEGCHVVGFSSNFGSGEIVAPNATTQSFCQTRTDCSLFRLPLELNMREMCCFDSMQIVSYRSGIGLDPFEGGRWEIYLGGGGFGVLFRI